MFTAPAEFYAYMEKVSYCWERASALPDCFERRVLMNFVLPHFGLPSGRHPQIAVDWDQEKDHWEVRTAYARTIVNTIFDVEDIIRKEVLHPGSLEEYLTGRNSYQAREELIAKTQAEARERAEAAAAKRLSAVGLSLKDLGL